MEPIQSRFSGFLDCLLTPFVTGFGVTKPVEQRQLALVASAFGRGCLVLSEKESRAVSNGKKPGRFS